jgi:hypothetical protein
VTADALGQCCSQDSRRSWAVPSAQSCHTANTLQPRPFAPFPYTLGPPLPYPPGSREGYFFKSKPKAMSYRNDTKATYDRALLSSVPGPTRAERQVRSSIFSIHPSPPFFRDWQSEPVVPVPVPPPFLHLPRPSLTSIPVR